MRKARWLPHGEMPAQVSAHTDRLIMRLCQLQCLVALFSHGQFGAALAVRWVKLLLAEWQNFVLYPASLGMQDHDAAHPDRRVITRVERMFMDSVRVKAASGSMFPVGAVSEASWSPRRDLGRTAPAWWGQERPRR